MKRELTSRKEQLYCQRKKQRLLNQEIVNNVKKANKSEVQFVTMNELNVLINSFVELSKNTKLLETHIKQFATSIDKRITTLEYKLHLLRSNTNICRNENNVLY